MRYYPVMICTAPIAKVEQGQTQQYFTGLNVMTLKVNGISVGITTIDQTSRDPSSGYGSEQHCELVAISEALMPVRSRVAKHHNHLLPGHPGYVERENTASSNTENDKQVRFYNVLRIEWKNGVAYRKGVGAIEKEAWDSLQSKVTTFKLG